MSVYQEPVHQGKTNTLALLSLIAGILSVLLLVLSLCIPCGLRIMALIFGAAAAIMGFMGKKKIDESAGAETGRGLAVGGLITGLIGAVGALILMVLFALVITGSTLFPFLEGYY
jgi:hypothetical protein